VWLNEKLDEFFGVLIKRVASKKGYVLKALLSIMKLNSTLDQETDLGPHGDGAVT